MQGASLGMKPSWNLEQSQVSPAQGRMDRNEAHISLMNFGATLAGGTNSVNCVCLLVSW